MSSIKLNLGAGSEQIEGWISIDISNEHHPKVLHDLEKGIPYDNNTVDEIRAWNFLEHISDTIFMMNEIWRVCKHNAKVLINVPHFLNALAIADPTHKKLFNEESFNFFCSNEEHYHIHKSYGIIANFHMISQEVNENRKGGYVKVILKVIKQNG